VVECIDDVHCAESVSDVLSIRTYYESQWLSRGITIKYIAFNLPAREQYAEPDVEIELDEYRSYGRNKRSCLETSK
ncbi:MAG: tRNA (guanosine(46)-N7)-methyltransferase TrmB, partial [Bacteroidaceae bacterium]|nr:tRNA (guanosine(46)-N7)-methyltransferase TrmB [Bacteroidaceae bacterium]